MSDWALPRTAIARTFCSWQRICRLSFRRHDRAASPGPAARHPSTEVDRSTCWTCVSHALTSPEDAVTSSITTPHRLW